MGVGAFVEPLVVVTLLFGGTWVNRNKHYKLTLTSQRCYEEKGDDEELLSPQSPYSEDNLLNPPGSRSVSPPSAQSSTWRKRELKVAGYRINVKSPNTLLFRDRFLSRLLLKYPFLVEAWYWALIYWVYQLGRAFTAVYLVEGTVIVARRHALQIIHLEQKLHLFWELPIQAFFLEHPTVMHWINRIYSFIHIPGTILFLVGLYFYTTTRNRIEERGLDKEGRHAGGSPSGPKLYEARRRTMAVCNLLAFIVFTLWPCMPPRLLSDRDAPGAMGVEARGYYFVDTVHGTKGESSVWTQNKFCNQYAAMPSLHFGYALMIGLTIALLPLAPQQKRNRPIALPFGLRLRLPAARRLICVTAGMSYSLTILVAIIATANHFILDAVAGAMVCALGWWGNGILLNLLPLEDYFLWCVRIHKPLRFVVNVSEGDTEGKVVVEEPRNSSWD